MRFVYIYIQEGFLPIRVSLDWVDGFDKNLDPFGDLNLIIEYSINTIYNYEIRRKIVYFYLNKEWHS